MNGAEISAMEFSRYDCAAMMGQPCAHCSVSPATRPRGLCWSCYYTPEIRKLHKPVGSYWRNGMVIALRQGVQQPRGVRPASAPTDAMPGTRAKVEVMCKRAELGQELWHPQDASFDDEFAELDAA